MEREPAVYIVASGFHGTVYTGVTSNLLQRVYRHRVGKPRGAAARYGCRRLVWFEMHGNMENAIVKVALIDAANPTWRDLAEDFGFEPLVGKVEPGSDGS